jgi:hypothetical protein
MHAGTEAPPQAASAVSGAMPLTASTAGTLDGGEGPERLNSLPSIGPFAHGDTPAARKRSRVPGAHGQRVKPPSGGHSTHEFAGRPTF